MVTAKRLTRQRPTIRIRSLFLPAQAAPGGSGEIKMFAVIVTGGKQYRVQEGSVLRVEKLPGSEGAAVEFGQVLLVGEGTNIKVGKPFLDGGKVTATIQSHGKGDKVRIVKFRRRKHYKREKTHRQPYTEITVTGIVG
jgi:large subunit ribosomal protein L21